MEWARDRMPFEFAAGRATNSLAPVVNDGEAIYQARTVPGLGRHTRLSPDEGPLSMEPFDLLVRAPRIVTPASEVSATVAVKAGVIVAIEPFEFDALAAETLELDPDVVLMPGLVDSHVHVCDPGHTDWEGFPSATRAAAAGGITTLVDMPLDSVPSTVNVAALETKMRAAAHRILVDVGFWGGVVPDNLDDLAPLYDAGVLGFKCSLADSGSDHFRSVDSRQMEASLKVLRGLDAPLLVHAEAEAAAGRLREVHGRSYSDYLASRPRELENRAVAQVVTAARRTGGQAHIVHLSSSDGLPMIAAARREGVRLTAETCPHYLTLCAEEIADGATAFKCSPPIREAANRELLWRALNEGTLSLIASDHSPCTVDMKHLASGDFGSAWGGISSLQLSLSVVWTDARRRGLSLRDVARWMAERPALLAGLSRKGQIVVGADADFSVFAPDERFVVDPTTLHHRNPITPYAGLTLSGVVRTTFLRGERVDPSRPRGRLLTREAA